MTFNTYLLQALPVELGGWGSLLKDIILYVIIAVLLYIALFYVLRFWLRKFESDVALITLNVSRGPILAIFILASMKIVVNDLGEAGINQFIQRALTAGIIVTVSYWIGQLFTQVIVYYLRSYAEKSEAMWDDVLVPLLERILPAVVYFLGAFLALQTIGIDFTWLWVGLGGATLVLGYGIKPILTNFMSGFVLLVDTPFQFGDVLSMPGGNLAVIKKIGIRMSKLYYIDTHCEVYVPNGNLQNQNITNLSRPTSHYYYTIKMAIKSEADPMRAVNLMREVVLGHPDTLGEIDEKLKYIDKYYEWQESDGTNIMLQKEAGHQGLSKKEAGRQRLLAEKKVNEKIRGFKGKLKELQLKIKDLEKGGLDKEEVRTVQIDYIEIAKEVGLEVVGDRQNKRTRTRLEEEQEMGPETLIRAIREWYIIWLKDPNMLREDRYVLPEEWERKIELLKLRMNRLFQKLLKPEGDETRLDDYVEGLIEWLNERLKNDKNEWQEPKIRMDNVSVSQTQFIVKYYIDDIKLEHCERGYRVNSEVRHEMVRQLRKAYLYS